MFNMIVHCAKSTCIFAFVGGVYYKTKESGMELNIKTKKNIRVRRIHWEKRPIKHTPSFWFEFVSIVASKSVALCFGFNGTQVQLHMNF